MNWNIIGKWEIIFLKDNNMPFERGEALQTKLFTVEFKAVECFIAGLTIDS